MGRTGTRLTLVAAALAVAVAAGYTTWTRLPAEHTCRSCHEIGPSFDTWTSSAHRDMACIDCHGTATSQGLHSLREKSRMLLVHFTGSPPDVIRANEEQTLAIMDRCIDCHRSQHADWIRSGHSATYAAIFLDETHNREEEIHPDCLKCHGMYFDGGVEDLVEPLTTDGPWRILPTGQADRPVIPCLACHEIHSPGEPATRPDYSAPREISTRRPESPSPLVWYDRYTRQHIRGADMVVRPVLDGNRPVDVSSDERQRVCFQCHAPDPMAQAGTSDDRTPVGVHEGISCLACHSAHSQQTGDSCGQCHPAMSNCGLDVKTMDTTFRDPNSSHNVHFVECADCHPDGVPIPISP